MNGNQIKAHMPPKLRQCMSDVKYEILKQINVKNDRNADSQSLSELKPISDVCSNWCDNIHVIRHAGGEIDGRPYLNCLEAFQNSAEMGCKALEADLQLTTDDHVVLLHDMKSAFDIEQDESVKLADTETMFMNRKIAGKYTPMNIESLVEFMKEYPDIYIITDCKQQSMSEVLSQIVATVKRESEKEQEHILSHMVIQLYHYEDCDIVQQIYQFPNMIFTLYDSGLYIWNAERIVKHCIRNKIGVVTMPYGFIRNKHVLDLFNRFNIRVFVHTINVSDNTDIYCKAGVWGIYSDNMTEWNASKKDI